jgi:hypothetical protein
VREAAVIADLAFVNGRIATLAAANRTVGCLAARDGRIIALGNRGDFDPRSAFRASGTALNSVLFRYLDHPGEPRPPLPHLLAKSSASASIAASAASARFSAAISASRNPLRSPAGSAIAVIARAVVGGMRRSRGSL